MSQLKEIGGRYYSPCKVVMLTTKNMSQSVIMLGVVPNWMTLTKDVIDDSDWKRFGKPQHLYFLSDEEIKEGDCVISTYDNWTGTGSIKPQLGKIISVNDSQYVIDIFNGNGYSKWDKGYSKKIIATTDASLKQIIQHHNDFDSVWDLAKPSQSFINKYIEEYNKGNQIVDVLVEYEIDWKDSTKVMMLSYGDNPDNYKYEPNIKIDSNNTITIKKQEDMFWNKKYLSQVFKTVNDENFMEWLYERMVNTYKEDKDYDYMLKFKSIVDWTKENL